MKVSENNSVEFESKEEKKMDSYTAYKDYEYSALKRAKKESHNLAEIVRNFQKEMKLDSYGVSNNYFCNVGDDVVSGFLNGKDGVRDIEVVKKYLSDLKEHKFKAEPFFTKDDGEIYHLVKNFYNSDLHSREQSMYILNIARFFNKMNRQINDDVLHLLKKKQFWDEKPGAEKVRKAYATGKVVKIMPPIDSPAPFGCSWNRNPLKEAAWIVVHSYLIDVFIPEETQLLLTPKDKSLMTAWNSYVMQMDDVPENVKKYFLLNEDGSCIFRKVRENVSTSSTTTKADQNNDKPKEKKQEEKVEAEVVAFAETAPTEDDSVPFEDAIVVDGTAVPVEKKNETDTKKSSSDAEAKKKNKEMNKAMEEAIAMDDEKDEKKATHPDQQKQQNTVEYISPYRENNLAFESKISGLNRFTTLAHKNGCAVFYANSAQFNGIVDAIIFSQDNPGVAVNKLMIDPMIIYGDSLRVVTMNNNQGDIRKEDFISINQPDVVVKLILKTYTKEDHDKHNKDLPRVLGDFRNKYHFLDLVDLKGCTGSNSKFKNSMPYGEWRKLVVNVSNILKDKNIPVCRFRVVDVESGDKFKLICDSTSTSAFLTTIFNEDSEREAVNNNFWVVFDIQKYKKSAGYFTLQDEINRNNKKSA